jgi:uncharacterized protein (UPF0276 family)
MTIYQEVDADYRTWEADNGMQKHRMQDMCSRSPLDLSFHGLCMTIATARNGDVLGYPSHLDCTVMSVPNLHGRY